MPICHGKRFGDFAVDHAAIGDAGGIATARQKPQEMHVALATDPFEPCQLGERLGMVVDPQIEIGPIFFALDQEGRRLFSPLVAARRLARRQRCDQAAGKRQRIVVGVSCGGRVEHARVREHVAGDRERLARAMSAAFHAG